MISLRAFFSYYHSQRIFVLTYEKQKLPPTKNRNPHRKTELYMLKRFFVDYTYIKTRQHKKKILFSILKQRAYVQGQAACFTTDGNCRCHRFAQSFFEKMTSCRHQNIAGDDLATIMVNRNSTNIAYTFRFYASLRLRDRDWCSVADGNGSCHGLAPSFFKEMTRCQH